MDKRAIIKSLAEEMRKLTGDPLDADEVKLRFSEADDLNTLLSEGPVIISIFNHSTFKFDYLSPNVEQLLGLSAGCIEQLDYQEFLKVFMHPEDINIIASRLFPDVVSFMNYKAKEEIMNFSVHYNYRMRSATGQWIKIEQQTTPVKINEKRKILLDQSFYRQVGKADFHEYYPLKLSIFYRNEGLYELCFSQTYLQKKPKDNSITPREMEIIKMLAEGITSSEIAHVLNISETTVMTHRRNMLNKLMVKNTGELIAWAFRSALL